jgi:hypothetical protein
VAVWLAPALPLVLNLNMAADSLAEIDGLKPKVLLRDGESREAKASHG